MFSSLIQTLYLFLIWILAPPADECQTDADCTTDPALTVCDTSGTSNVCVGKLCDI